ncbi:hypothetical protein [Streptomyces omiyaensis]|uniref:Secreted protein n=1 Tax=Streptomyces omiyaensis TaxID=68247 RepID=A0ABW7BRB7_9ACTN|nr:hypothetical protein GCM10010363_04730 [Streptomyces omiyaensis]
MNSANVSAISAALLVVALAAGVQAGLSSASAGDSAGVVSADDGWGVGPRSVIAKPADDGWG